MLCWNCLPLYLKIPHYILGPIKTEKNLWEFNPRVLWFLFIENLCGYKFYVQRIVENIEYLCINYNYGQFSIYHIYLYNYNLNENWFSVINGNLLKKSMNYLDNICFYYFILQISCLYSTQ